MADLCKEIEADWPTDLGKSLQDGSSEHSVLRILSCTLNLWQESNMVTLVCLDGLTSLLKGDYFDVSLI